jgi:Spy/CpxP family protein refolding chaperone
MKNLMSVPSASPLRMLAATLVVAVAGGMAQVAIAAPHDGPGPGGHAGMGGGMGGMAMAAPQHIVRLLDSVGATAEQRTQIKQIMQAAHTELAAQRQAGRALHEQSRALFAQPTVDARAAEALRVQMVAQHEQASKRMLQAMLDVSRVLTPEQRKAMADRMGQRRTMMDRHRAEREAMEKAPR